MEARIHSNLALKRWCEFTMFEQLAHIGYEVLETIHAKNSGDLKLRQQSLGKALELIDLTLLDPKITVPRRKEISTVREILIDYFVYNNAYGSTDEFLEKYFLYFSHIVETQRGG